MRLELDEKYTSAKTSRIRLQNKPSVISLANWLACGDPVWRWNFYLKVLRPVAYSGGAVQATPRMASTRWIAETRARLVDDEVTFPLPFLEGLLTQKDRLDGANWEAIYREATSFKNEKAWLQSTGHALKICLSCDHWSIGPWDYVHGLESCESCRGDLFKLFPFVLSTDVKQAILEGVILELATAEAFSAAGGTVYSRNVNPVGLHKVGLRFEYPLGPVECDLIATLGPTTFYVECKDLKGGNTLPSREIELTTGRAGRLFQSVRKNARQTRPGEEAVLVVTTGKLPGDVDRERIRNGELSESCLPVFTVLGHELVNLVQILQSTARDW